VPQPVRLALLGMALGGAGLLTALALAYLGMSLIIPLDFLSHSFTWIGIERPPSGWALLGGLGGGAVGAVQGLKRARMRSAIPRVWGGAAALGCALLLAAYLVGR
jgi:hypothetical protein